MFEVLHLCGLDELVGDMVVDPGAAHAKSEHSQRVLVVVGQRTMADCTDEDRNGSFSSKPLQHVQNCFLIKL